MNGYFFCSLPEKNEEKEEDSQEIIDDARQAIITCRLEKQSVGFR